MLRSLFYDVQLGVGVVQIDPMGNRTQKIIGAIWANYVIQKIIETKGLKSVRSVGSSGSTLTIRVPEAATPQSNPPPLASSYEPMGRRRA